MYLIDWGYPGRGDRWLTLDDYINGYVDDCVEVVRERHGAEKVNVLGVCQGGVSALCYGALHPEKVATLTTMVAPEVELGGRRVDLGSLRMPILNVYAEQDDFIPPESAAALERHVGTDDYTARSFPVGHIGMYVSGRAQRELPPVLAQWLRER